MSPSPDHHHRRAPGTPRSARPGRHRADRIRAAGRRVPAGTAALALVLLAACAGTPAERAARRGQALLEAGRLTEALELYREARQSHPELAPLHHGEGLALHRLERPAEAEAPLRRAVELDPEEARFHLVLGHALFDLGRPEEAVAAYREATRLAPRAAEAWRALGFAEYNLRHYPEARAALESYLAFARDAEDYYAVSQLLNALPPDPEESGE
jgi:tetratricopeptide (TPR) repeat protein